MSNTDTDKSAQPSQGPSGPSTSTSAAAEGSVQTGGAVVTDDVARAGAQAADPYRATETNDYNVSVSAGDSDEATVANLFQDVPLENEANDAGGPAEEDFAPLPSGNDGAALDASADVSGGQSGLGQGTLGLVSNTEASIGDAADLTAGVGLNDGGPADALPQFDQGGDGVGADGDEAAAGVGGGGVPDVLGPGSAIGDVADVDAAPNAFDEDAAAGTVVGLTALAVDPDGDAVTYSIDDARFVIDPATGIVTVADGAAFDAETEGTVTVVVTATSEDGSSSSETFVFTVNDVNEGGVGPVSDSDATANTFSEDAAAGDGTGLTAFADDPDISDSVTYSIDDPRFDIDPNTGVVTIAEGAAFDAETEGAITVTVTATSTDGSTETETFTFTVTDADEFDVGPLTDVDATANAVAENSAAGTVVGITAFAEDQDVSDTVTYSIDDARFDIDPATGVITVAAGANLDAETTTSIDVVVTATSTDGSTANETFTITITDENEFAIGPVSDTDATANAVAENSSAGTVVGITAFAEDQDVSDTVTYSIDDARFDIDPATGVITVAAGANLDAETTSSIDVVVTATSTDGSTANETFTITITDENEFAIGPVSDTDATANAVAENSAAGTVVGITAFAEDQDVSDTVTYSIDDARFDIDPATGVITVAAGANLDAETTTSIDVVVTATSTDGSTANETFTITVTDENEFAVGPVSDTNATANAVAENSAAGTVVGITAFAEDQDVSDTVTYSINDARFDIDPATGVITVAAGANLDAETTSSIDVVVTATSTDGSSASETFTISITDENEFAISPVTDVDATANEISGAATAGTSTGLTAFAEDQDVSDTVSYTIDDARFDIDPATGVVTVASGATFDAGAEPAITVIVTATSTDGSSTQETFTINVTGDIGPVSDVDGATNAVAENSAAGTVVGITANAVDPNPGDTVTYSINDARFDIDPATGVITVAAGASLDAETTTSIDVVVTATSTDGSSSSETFTISITDENEFAIGPVSDTDATANAVAENSAAGTVVGITAFAEDQDVSDTVTYSINDARFDIDPATGVITVAAGANLDAETTTSIDVIVTATSTDGSSSSQTFTISITDENEFAIGPVSDTDATANAVAENSAAGTVVGITAFAEDQDVSDTVTYTINDARFDIDPATGVITVAAGANLDAETTTSIDVVVTATSTDGSSASETFTISITDENEFAIGPVSDTDATANAVAENSAAGTVVGITAFAEDQDVSDTVTYSINDARFDIDPATGVITVAAGANLDAETTTSIDVVVTATSTDGSSSSETFTISITDENEFAIGTVSDTDATANAVAENSAAGTVVGITAFAEDQDVSDTVSYSINDARFDIDPATGVITVAAGANLDAETTTSIDVVVTATSTDGSTSTETFTISITDENEFAIGPVADVDATANAVAENSAAGTVVGITAFAEDQDVSDTVTYSINDARFDIDPATGVITVAAGANLDAETTSSIDVVVTATSTDGTSSSETFTISITDENEFAIGPVSDTDATANAVAENSAAGTVVGITAFAEDQDVSDSVTYSINDARFDIDPATGVITVAAGANLDAETTTSIDVVVTATSTDGSSSNETFTISITDENEFAIGPVSDVDATANAVDENSAGGTVVGITAFAEDQDVSDSVTYSINDARFVINATTGVITVAAGAVLDAEATPSIDVVVTATSTDGSTSTETFTIDINDVNEAIGPVSDTDAIANTVAENGTGGEYVGITAFASDPDAGDTVTYSINDARFEIDADTGVITVADGVGFDHETTSSIDIEVTATSSDGSTSSETFTVDIGDQNEAPDLIITGDGSSGLVVSVTVTENLASLNNSFGIFYLDVNGDPVAGEILATGGDELTVGATLTAHLDGVSDLANVGFFLIPNGGLLNPGLEAGESVTFSETLGIWNVLDSSGDPILGLGTNVIFSGDGGLNLGGVDQSLEAGLEISLGEVLGGGDFSDLVVTVSVDSYDDRVTVEEESLGAEVAPVTVIDPDDGDTHTFTVSDDRFEVVDNGSGYVLKLKDDQALDYETETFVNVEVTVTDSGGLSDTETIHIDVTDVDESDVGPLSDVDAAVNTVAENSAGGTVVGITAFAEDPDGTDTVTYSITDARFDIDATTGVITVANGATIDAETTSSIDIEVTATSTDGSTSTETFTITVTDENEFSVGPLSDVDATANAVAEDATAGTAVGITAFAQDQDVSDTVTYSITDPRFVINATTGVITLASGATLDAEATPTIDIEVTATSSDGSIATETFTLAVTDANEFSVGPVSDVDATVNAVAENSAGGTVVGVTAFATDPDASDTVTYSINDARFDIDATTGVITVADGANLDAESVSSIDVVVTATSTDGSTSMQTFTIAVTDENEFSVGPVSDVDGSLNAIAEDATAGTVVGITAFATDPDATDTVTYSIDDARFVIDANTGVITLAGGVTLDAETTPTIDVVVTATSSDGSTSSNTFTINVTDENEAPDLVVGDSAGSYNYIENGSFELFSSSGLESGYGDSRWYGNANVQGWTVNADIHSSGWDNNLGTTDGDYRLDLAGPSNNGSASQNVQGLEDGETYRLSFDLRHRGETGDAVVRVFWGGVLVAEITPGDTSADWQSYTFDVIGGSGDGTDQLRFEEVGTDNYKGTQIDNVALVDVTDIAVSENDPGAEVVALTVVDPDVGDTHTFTVSDSRFEVVVDGDAYVLRLKDGQTLDYETEQTVTVSVTATDSGGLSDTETIEIRVIDQDDLNPIYGTEEFIHVGDTTALSLADDLSLFEGVEVSVGQLLNGELTLTSLLDVQNGLDVLNTVEQLLFNTGDVIYDTLSGATGVLNFDFDRDLADVSFEVSDLYAGLLGLGTERGAWFAFDDGNLVGSGSYSGTFTGQDTIDIDVGALFDQVVLTADASTLGLGSDYTFEQILYTDVDLTVSGNDTLTGSDGDDQIYGLSGQDTIYGLGGDDLIVGGTRDDNLFGGDGSDTFLYAMGDGDDTIVGGAGASWIDMIDLQDGTEALGTYGTDWTVTVTDGSIDNVDLAGGEITLSDDAAGYIDLADGSRIDFTEIESIQF